MINPNGRQPTESEILTFGNLLSDPKVLITFADNATHVRKLGNYGSRPYTYMPVRGKLIVDDFLHYVNSLNFRHK